MYNIYRVEPMFRELFSVVLTLSAHNLWMLGIFFLHLVLTPPAPSSHSVIEELF